MVGWRVNSGLPFDQIDLSEASFDTSVLFNYTLGQDSGRARTILSEPSTVTVVSKNVKDEYEGVRTNRKKGIKSMLKAAGESSFEDWEPPQSLNLSVRDREWCKELHDELCEMSSDEKIEAALSQARRRFDTGYRTLFTDANRWIDHVSPTHSNALLIGYLCNIENHRDDMNIICDAASWSAAGGSGTFVTSDIEHMLSNRDEIMKKIGRNHQSGDIYMMDPDEFLNQR